MRRKGKTSAPPGDTEEYKKIMNKNLSEYLAALDRDGEEVKLKFIDNDIYNIRNLIGISNQIIVRYKNGSIEILPPGITERRVGGYLGFRILHIKSWALLPLFRAMKDGYCVDAYNKIEFK